MVFTIYTEQHYQDRKIPLIGVFIIVNSKCKSHKKGRKKHQNVEKYIIVNNYVIQ